ncbi:MAG: hypothetical protein HQL48_05545 [Gammaproteobacteria bacterium]|nr:hypothetical protein [Gammaproteobacteria bacterium]
MPPCRGSILQESGDRPNLPHNNDPEQLRKAILAAAEVLGLARAELARILGLRCPGITAFYSGELPLLPGSEVRLQGERLVCLHHLLQQQLGGVRSKMVHWLRREQPTLGGVPFYLIVDEGKLAHVLEYLQESVISVGYCDGNRGFQN